MPAGTASGSKLMSRQLLSASATMRSTLSVPASTCGRPGKRRIVGRIARLADSEDQMPLRRRLLHTRDQLVEQIVLVGRRIAWFGREDIDCHHGPAHRRRFVSLIDKQESIERIVGRI